MTLLPHLPADGAPIVADLAIQRSGLAPGAAWPKLAALCAGGEAKAWRHEGVTWARRIDRVALTNGRRQATREESAAGVATKGERPRVQPEAL